MNASKVSIHSPLEGRERGREIYGCGRNADVALDENSLQLMNGWECFWNSIRKSRRITQPGAHHLHRQLEEPNAQRAIGSDNTMTLKGLR
jgi:hypothetical protein